MRSQYISAHEHREREIRDDEQGMRNFDTGQLKRTSTYPLTSAQAPPTPTISGAGFLKGWMGGLLGSFAYSAVLSIEKAEPVSTSASRTCTESMIASVNTCGAQTPADSTAFDDF